MKTYHLLFLSLILAACGGPKAKNTQSVEETLRTGDLIFVGLPQDYGDEDSMEGAISSSTGDGELNLIHVAIADVDPSDKVWIIDATIAHGVERHPLDTFLTDFTLNDGSLPVFIVKRLVDPADAARFIENAKSLCGQPYDVSFLPDNGALYCSELVRESYRGSDGSYLFDEKPMNWKNSEGVIPGYWVRLFASIGQSVPQDVPGTNPQDMSSSPLLRTVELQFP